MGLLTVATPMQWAEAKKYADHVREHGIKQFINIYYNLRDRHNDSLKFGEEIEFIVINIDDEKETARLNLRVDEILPPLLKEEQEATKETVLEYLWRPEYGAYMIEGTPGRPYGHDVTELIDIERNMRTRRRKIMNMLKDGEHIVSMTNFPRLGCPDAVPGHQPYGKYAKSLFVPDEAINPHPRFGTLTACIRERRGCRVDIKVPIYRDEKTPRPFVETFANDDGEAAVVQKPDTIYMDAMCFGMGCCCTQVTFQACSIDEARFLYDQLANVAPIMLALTAGAPIFRGYLADVDCRWNVISQAVDDRTPEEYGRVPLKNDRFVIPKSRYDSISSYLSTQPLFKDKYNDTPLVLDQKFYDELVAAGIDHMLARHIAHLFIRDPLVVFKETLDQDDKNQSEHFENIQSTNWQSLRFKPPPPNSDIGWRVEFRTMELQMTDFENAAFTVFIVLLTRAIVSFNLNMYIPISKVDHNMQAAQKRDAAHTEKYYFRRHLSAVTPDGVADPDEFELMDLNTIINGQEGGFPGLMPFVHSYLGTMNVDVDTHCKLTTYLNFVSKRASGELMTTAGWLRKYVREHPDYKHDSVVSEKINYDICKIYAYVGAGYDVIPELTGDYLKPRPVMNENSADADCGGC